jgi:two-component system cell cycle sensor histidine kinase/response regulator CckA
MPGSPAPRIIIVDDDNDIRYTFSIVVRRKGFQLAGALADGSEAVAEFQKNPACADIVIMDYRMPIMRGNEAAREIRKINPEVKIVLLSGYQEDLSPEDHKLFNATLRKPVSISDFVRAIERALQSPAGETTDGFTETKANFRSE